jgi:hypothetical protein
LGRPIVLELASGAHLVMRLVEYEANDPEKGDYLSFDAEVRAGEFSGRTSFWISRRGVENFVEELSQFNVQLSGTASMVSGWGQEIYFSLNLFPYDTLGHLGAEIQIASPTGGRWSALNRVTVEVATEPLMVEAFLQDLRAVLDKKNTASGHSP